MAITFKLITSLTVSANTQFITLSSFPSSSTYNDFMLIARLNDSTSGAYQTNGTVIFNNLTNINTDSVVGAFAEGNTKIGARINNGGQLFYFRMSASLGGSANFAVNTMYVQGYNNSHNPKPVITNTSVSGGTSAFGYRGMLGNTWQSSTAITRLDIYAGSQNIVSGSSFYVYGIQQA